MQRVCRFLQYCILRWRIPAVDNSGFAFVGTGAAGLSHHYRNDQDIWGDIHFTEILLTVTNVCALDDNFLTPIRNSSRGVKRGWRTLALPHLFYLTEGVRELDAGKLAPKARRLRRRDPPDAVRGLSGVISSRLNSRTPSSNPKVMR